jgi:hypothetical protein
MIGTSPITRWRTGLAVLSLLGWSHSSFAQSRTLTVRDAIEMQAFIDPYPFPATSYPAKEVKDSPDNRWFAVVTERGILKTNELESTIWIFDRGAVGRFLNISPGAEAPKPRAVARIAAVANDSAITQLRWLTGNELAFLGRDKTSDRSLFTADVVTGTLKKLTPNGQDVTGFDIAGDTIVYTAARRHGEAPVPGERVITGHPLISLLDPEGPPFDPMLGKPAELWVVRDQKASPVVDRATGKPVQLITNLLALSPSGHTVVVTQYAERIPKAWEGYEPFPCVACNDFRLKASPPGAMQADPMFRFMNPKQYALVDLDTGKLDPIDAPFGLALLYAGPEKAIWVRHGQSLILVNTYLPLENTEDSERQQRLQKPCVALFDNTSKHVTCIATIKQTSREEYSRTGTGFFLRDVLWDGTANDLVLSYETFGNENDPTHHEQPPEVYRRENGRWVMQDMPTVRTTGSLRVELRQDLNEPPALFVSEPNGDHHLKLWDPNRQLSCIRLGEVSVLHWKDKGGREWTGGLVKPPDYVPGHRYPLVIQTHGFNQHEFMTVGAFTTAFAARPIAATGMMVVQVEDRSDLLNAPEEAALNVEGFLALVDHLANAGLVDPQRVGLVGFSRTGYHTLEALTKTPKRFAAATIADSDFLGYWQRLVGVDLEPGDSLRREGVAIYGSQPFGNGLKTWIERAPAFNLDKVLAPLRIEVHDLNSLVFDWELYAGLRLQGKPVDMIQLLDADHVLVKPLERLASEQGDLDWFDFWLNGHEDPDPAKVEQYKRWRLLREEKAENMRSAK